MDEIDLNMPEFNPTLGTTRLSTPASRLRNARDRLKTHQLELRLSMAENAMTLAAMVIRDAIVSDDPEFRLKVATQMVLPYGLGKPGTMTDEDLENQRKASGKDFFDMIASLSAEGARRDQEARQLVQQTQPQQTVVPAFARHPLEDIVDVGDDE